MGSPNILALLENKAADHMSFLASNHAPRVEKETLKA
jgi:hypothetical protein